MPANSLSAQWRRRVRPAWGVRFRDPRHSHATLALRASIHPEVVSERLGHATISITLDTFSHAIPAMQDEAAGKIAELVFAAKWLRGGPT